ncbi:hypothetical protein L873DRAFT_1795233 [Choiromyces venosus 120613-1]|uniref:Uncharacterized protein n=1 Tax=Choiromyces venosus 120613-1 TaxID=1336337 RepID=A0A3N4IXF6_9PEZI|nr:hypothetical protein L873DRAFT_1795233 [Choiromyces venosus 120613-1]
MTPRQAGCIQVHPILPALSAERFYTGDKKKPGSKLKQLAESLRTAPQCIEYPNRLYKVSYKVRELSYWVVPSIPIGWIQLWKPTRVETAACFGVSEVNLSHWRKEEKEGKFQGLSLEQYEELGGGRK